MPALPWTSRTTPDPDAAYVVMGSRLPLRGYRFVPRFLAHSMKIRRQLAGADGLIGYALNARLTQKEFWTVSVWQSRDELERFAAANPHATIIRTKPERMAQSKFVFWTCVGREVPIGWHAVAEHLDVPGADGLADRDVEAPESLGETFEPCWRCSRGRIWPGVRCVVVSGVVACSIVLADRWPDVDLTELAGRAGAPEARGLISISVESWPQPAGSTVMRAVISIEADNAGSIRWYVREILGLRQGHPACLDMERQLLAPDKPAGACHPA